MDDSSGTADITPVNRSHCLCDIGVVAEKLEIDRHDDLAGMGYQPW